MLAKAFFDTNLLVYAAIGEDSRSARAEKLLYAGGIVSVQVLNEFVSVGRRKLRMPWGDVREALRWVRRLCPDPVPLTTTIHEEAIGIAQRYEFSIYDSLIVASALKADCNVLYSEDFQDGQVIEGRLTIQNPFR